MLREEKRRARGWAGGSQVASSSLLCNDRYGTARASEGAVMHATLWYNQARSVWQEQSHVSDASVRAGTSPTWAPKRGPTTCVCCVTLVLAQRSVQR